MPLKRCGIVFVASSRYNELKGRPVPLKELVSYPLLLLSNESTSPQAAGQFS